MILKKVKKEVQLTQGQCHQNLYNLVDTKKGYYRAQSERSPVNSVREKANVKVIVKSESTSLISFNMRKSEEKNWYIH